MSAEPVTTLFLDHLRYEKRLSEHTLTAYASDLDQLVKYLLFQYECDQPEIATAPMLRSWVVSLVEEKLNATSVNRKMATLRSFYGFLRRRQLIADNPARNLQALKTKRNFRPLWKRRPWNCCSTRWNLPTISRACATA